MHLESFKTWVIQMCPDFIQFWLTESKHMLPHSRTWMWAMDRAVPAVWGTLAQSSTILVYWVVSFGNTSYKNNHKQDLIMLLALSQHVSWADVNCEATVPSFLICPVTDSTVLLKENAINSPNEQGWRTPCQRWKSHWLLSSLVTQPVFTVHHNHRRLLLSGPSFML